MHLIKVIAWSSIVSGLALAAPRPAAQAPLVRRDEESGANTTASLQCPWIKRYITTELYKRCLFFRTNVLEDPFHCGSCFNVCGGATPYCVSGVCRDNPPIKVKLRIEGNELDGTLFEGEIATAGHDITTLSGGTHHCDGTNDNASGTRGGTFTSALDDAARLNAFTYNGDFYSQFDDYLITRVANSANSAAQNRFWGLLRNNVLEDSGGCQEKVVLSDEHLWAYDVFRPGHIVLSLTGSAIARLGKPVVYTVLGHDPQLGTTAPVAGAKVFDQYTDADGKATVIFHQRCVFPLKATKVGHVRSNGIWTAVI